MSKVDEFAAKARAYNLTLASLHGYGREWSKPDFRDLQDMARLRDQVSRADAVWAEYQEAARAMNDPEPLISVRVDDMVEGIGPEFGEPVF